MLEYLFSLSLLIVAVIVIRAICKKRVSGKLVYALWLAVILRLIVPVNLISIDMPFPEITELVTSVPEVPSHERTEQVTLDSTIVKPIKLPENNTPTQAEPAPLDNKITESTIKIDTEKVLLYAWLLGSGITLITFAVPFGITEIKLRKSRRYHSTVGTTKVFVSDRVATPCVTGIIPKIYITPAAEECCDLSLIILHEKTHIRHGDHLWALFRIALIIAFWWNPLIWAAALLSKRDAEVACDESVVRSMSSEERINYGRLIVDMIPKRGGFAVAFANKPIKYRLLRLTGRFKTTVFAAIIAVVTMVLCCLLAFVSNGVDDGENTILHFHKFSEKATCTASARCACGDVKGKPLGHKWVDADCENPKTCSRCSLTEGIPLEHSWVEAGIGLKSCSDCNETVGVYHEHNWLAATCTAPEYCSLCRETKGVALGHSFTEATCTQAMTCTRCNYSEGNAAKHSFAAATCTDPAICSVCGYSEGKSLGHTWTEATCTGEKTCSVCGISAGSTLNHQWTDATCTEDSICTICNATGDKAKGHTWTEGSCTSPIACSGCGLVKSEAPGHNFELVGWSCTRCGALEPEFANKMNQAKKQADSMQGNPLYWFNTDTKNPDQNNGDAEDETD